MLINIFYFINVTFKPYFVNKKNNKFVFSIPQQTENANFELVHLKCNA